MSNYVNNIFDFLRENPDRPCILCARDLNELGLQLVQGVREEFEREQKVLEEQKEDKLLTPEEVMSIAQISRATLFRLGKAGFLEPIFIGGQRRYSRIKLQAYLNRR